MIRADKKIDKEDVYKFMIGVSSFDHPKITKKELKTYLEALPRDYSNKEINFLMNGKNEVTADEMMDLFSRT